MKTYLIKKEVKSIWKWGAFAMALIFIVFIIGENNGTGRSFIEMPRAMLLGELSSLESPLVSKGYFYVWFLVVSFLLGVILAVAQMRPEIQLKTFQFLIHRPVTKKNILDAKILTGLAVLIVSMGIPLSFVVLTCKISGNYAAPFYLDMIIDWVIGIYCACCFYLSVFYCCLQEGKYRKWFSLFSIPIFCLSIFLLSSYFPVWLMILVAILIWYFAILGSFEERDFS
jgi:hypothetical protein